MHCTTGKNKSSKMCQINCDDQIFGELINFLFNALSPTVTLQQPIKVWNSDRTNRRCIVASNLNDLKQKAAEKLGFSINLPSQLRLVLESNGESIENDENLMRYAAADMVFLLLRPNEKWTPPALGIFKNGKQLLFAASQKLITKN